MDPLNNLAYATHFFFINQELYVQSDNPEIFKEYFEYLVSLKTDEQIDYNFLKDIFIGGLNYADLKKESLGLFDGI